MLHFHHLGFFLILFLIFKITMYKYLIKKPIKNPDTTAPKNPEVSLPSVAIINAGINATMPPIE